MLLFPLSFLSSLFLKKRVAQKYTLMPLFFGILLLPSLSFGFFGGGSSSSNNPTISITANKSVMEGNTSTVQVELNITASDCPDTSDIKIHWETADGNATTSNNDYNEASDTVTFSVPGMFSSCQDSDKVKTITVTVNGDTDYEPDEDFHVNLSDGGTNSAQNYTIENNSTITIKNDDPSTSLKANDDTASTDTDTSVPIDVLANDTAPAGSTLTIESVTTPSHGTASITNNQIEYTPNAGYSGSDTFSYTVSDGNGGSDTATVVVSVKAPPVHVDHPPICMESLTYGKKNDLGSACFDGPLFKGGEGCIQILKLRNLSDTTITRSDINVDYSDFVGELDNTCGIDGTDQTGEDCNVSSDPKEAPFNPLGAFESYKAHTVYLGVKSAAGSSSPFDGTITVNYEQNGTEYTGTLEKCQVTTEPANDLCYDPPVEFDGLMCISMGDFFGGGIGCKTTIHLRNQGDDTLYSPIVNVITNSMFQGHMMDDCGIDGTSGNCSDSDVLSGPFMGMSGLGMPRTLTYDPMPDFDANDTHSTYSSSLMSMKLFSNTTLLGTYVKNGQLYRGEIRACGSNPGGYTTGPFDAWDTFRGDTNNDGILDDRNISTKVVHSAFHVTLASINQANNAEEPKPGIDVKYNLIDTDTNNTIDTWYDYDASNSEALSEEYNIDKAYKNLRVIFKVCTDYDTSSGQITLLPYSACTTDCNSDTEEGACFRYFNSSDAFAVRPKNFDVNISDGTTLTAAQNYALLFRAQDANEENTTAYNENEGSTFDVSLTLSDPSTHTCQYLTANNTPDVNFINGADDNNFSFDRVGDFNLTIAEAQECTQRFASVDCDDANVSGEWNTDENLSIEPKVVSIRLIPDHFTISGIYKDHHISNTDQNFTYLSNFVNNGSGASKAMASEYNLTITAKKADDTIASNYTKECFAKDVNITTSYESLDGNGNTVSLSPDLSKVQYYVKELDSGDDYYELNIGTDINYTLPSSVFDEEINGTANVKLEINFDRTYNKPLNPFKLHLKTITLNDVDTTPNTETIDQNTTFLYGRTKPSKYFYDDVTSSPITTPILVEVYCDKWPASATNCPSVDTLNGQTNDYRWYIATSHDMSAKDDGNITLTVSSDTGSLNDTTVSIDDSNDGIDNTIAVSGSAPNTVTIDLDTANTTDTSDWLIYNENSAALVPSPFYRVRFVGTGSWAGSGKTGHVVGGDSNKKKSRRLEW